MSQHSQRTQHGPSRASITGIGVAAVAAIAVSAAVTGQPAQPDWWHVLGAVGWMSVSWALAAQAVIRYGERQVARQRAARERQAEAARLEAAVLNTGTWRGEAAGQVLSVRYDPDTGRWYVCGWMGDHAVFSSERRWADRDTLMAAVRELEVTGELEPVDDQGTRAVRARLGLPGPWFEEVPLAPAYWATDEPDPARTEVLETVRDDLGADDTQQFRRPSPVALGPIQVPVFRTEADRVVWAREHDVPAEILPRHHPHG